MSTGIDDGADEFKWQLVLCLLFAWIIIFLCLIKGIKSSGKVLLILNTSIKSLIFHILTGCIRDCYVPVHRASDSSG